MTQKPAYRVDFAYLKRVVPLTAILSRYGLGFMPMGTRLRGACPIHKGSNKRQFVIDPNAGTWRCFGDCNAGGGPLEFVAAMEGIGIPEAAELIARWFAIATLRPQQQPERRKAMSGGRPAYKVFAVEDKKEEVEDFKPWWTRIGSAWSFKTKDGRNGISIQLQALPINDRIVLTEYDDEDAAEDEKRAANSNKKRK
jgi:hypothetical protein